MCSERERRGKSDTFVCVCAISCASRSAQEWHKLGARKKCKQNKKKKMKERPKHWKSEKMTWPHGSSSSSDTDSQDKSDNPRALTSCEQAESSTRQTAAREKRAREKNFRARDALVCSPHVYHRFSTEHRALECVARCVLAFAIGIRIFQLFLCVRSRAGTQAHESTLSLSMCPLRCTFSSRIHRMARL